MAALRLIFSIAWLPSCHTLSVLFSSCVGYNVAKYKKLAESSCFSRWLIVGLCPVPDVAVGLRQLFAQVVVVAKSLERCRIAAQHGGVGHRIIRCSDQAYADCRFCAVGHFSLHCVAAVRSVRSGRRPPFVWRESCPGVNIRLCAESPRRPCRAVCAICRARSPSSRSRHR